MQQIIKFLGVGGVFNPEWGNASALLNIRHQTIMLDCGFTVYPTLCRYNLTHSIDYVLISHLHNDHVGSLSNLIYHQALVDKKKTKLLTASREFEKTLAAYLSFSIPQLHTFVDFVPLSEFPEITAFNTFGLHVPDLQTFAFQIKTDQNSLIYSGDLADVHFVLREINPSKDDLIFHEAEYFAHAKAHSFYRHLQEVMEGRKVFIYHNNPLQKPADCTLPLVAETNEFLLRPANELFNKY
ncbi:MBL fold metallo-hydrolase [bacterium]|nr:MBL fold metallo-hydrolase [bacterium]